MHMLRFSDYDIFAYLVTGLAGIAMADLVLSTNRLIEGNWAVADGVFIALLAYIVGHIIASLAHWLIERKLVRMHLGRPIEIFLGRSKQGRVERLARRIVRQYYNAPSPKVVEKLRAIVEEQDIKDLDDLFVRAHFASKHEPASMARMDSFLKLYGFSRNIAFVALVGAFALLPAAGWDYGFANDWLAAKQKLQFAALSLIVGVGMLERYLKFYRLFVLELVLTLAHAKEESQ